MKSDQTFSIEIEERGEKKYISYDFFVVSLILELWTFIHHFKALFKLNQMSMVSESIGKSGVPASKERIVTQGNKSLFEFK